MFTRIITRQNKKEDKYVLGCEFCNKDTTIIAKRLVHTRYIKCSHCGKATEKEVFIRA